MGEFHFIMDYTFWGFFYIYVFGFHGIFFVVESKWLSLFRFQTPLITFLEILISLIE